MKALKVLVPVVVMEEHLIVVSDETTSEEAWKLVVEGNYETEVTRVGMSSDKDAYMVDDQNYYDWMVVAVDSSV